MHNRAWKPFQRRIWRMPQRSADSGRRNIFRQNGEGMDKLRRDGVRIIVLAYRQSNDPPFNNNWASICLKCTVLVYWKNGIWDLTMNMYMVYQNVFHHMCWFYHHLFACMHPWEKPSYAVTDWIGSIASLKSSNESSWVRVKKQEARIRYITFGYSCRSQYKIYLYFIQKPCVQIPWRPTSWFEALGWGEHELSCLYPRRSRGPHRLQEDLQQGHVRPCWPSQAKAVRRRAIGIGSSWSRDILLIWKDQHQVDTSKKNCHRGGRRWSA